MDKGKRAILFPRLTAIRWPRFLFVGLYFAAMIASAHLSPAISTRSRPGPVGACDEATGLTQQSYCEACLVRASRSGLPGALLGGGSVHILRARWPLTPTPQTQRAAASTSPDDQSTGRQMQDPPHPGRASDTWGPRRCPLPATTGSTAGNPQAYCRVFGLVWHFWGRGRHRTS